MPATVLVIDEEPEHRAHLAALLAPHDLPVRTAASAAAAWVELTGGAVGLVVIGSLKSGITAVALARSLASGFPNVPILVFGAGSAMPGELVGVENLAGPVRWLALPADPTEFPYQVQYSLGRVPAHTDPSMEAVSDALSVSGRLDNPVRLDRKLDRLLDALSRARTDPASRQQAFHLAKQLQLGAFARDDAALAAALSDVESAVGEILHGKRAPPLERWRALEAAVEAARAPIRAERPAAPPRPGIEGRLLLVGEDDRLLVESDFLERSGCFEVLRAPNAEAALSIAREARPDVAFVDLQMGKHEDGFRLVRTLSTITGLESMPIAVIGFHGTVPYRLAASRAGVSLFLTKPVSGQVFLAAARQLLARSLSPAKVLYLGDEYGPGAGLVGALRRHGMDVEAHLDATELLDQLGRFRPDLLLIDPASDLAAGFGACRIIRAMPRWALLPTLVILPDEALGLHRAAVEAGADDFLARPVDPDVLVSRIRMRQERSRLVRDQLLYDPQVQVYTRHAFYDVLAPRLDEAGRAWKPLSVGVVDVDGLDAVNTAYGHGGGDFVLDGLGRILATRLRPEDVRGRLRDGRFGVMFYGCEPGVAGTALERALSDFRDLTFRTPAGVNFGATFSAGVAGFPQHGTTVSELVVAAESKLRMAKDGGRNQVVV